MNGGAVYDDVADDHGCDEYATMVLMLMSLVMPTGCDNGDDDGDWSQCGDDGFDDEVTSGVQWLR